MREPMILGKLVIVFFFGRFLILQACRTCPSSLEGQGQRGKACRAIELIHLRLKNIIVPQDHEIIPNLFYRLYCDDDIFIIRDKNNAWKCRQSFGTRGMFVAEGSGVFMNGSPIGQAVNPLASGLTFHQVQPVGQEYRSVGQRLTGWPKPYHC